MQDQAANHIPDAGQLLSGESLDQELDRLLADARIDPFTIYEAPPVCLSITVNGETAIYGTLGNLSLIMGKAKSKKTFIATMMAAAAMRSTALQNTIQADLPANQQRIVYFDTEQHKYHVWKILKRSFRMAGRDETELDNTIDYFGLRKHQYNKRLQLIDRYLRSHTDIGIVFIDGVRDLILNINDSEQSAIVLDHLMRWSEVYNCHIVCIIHQNKGDGNARGHIGSELINKAETVIEVEKDEHDSSKSEVSPVHCRNSKDIPKFSFAIDDDGMPQILSGTVPNDIKTAKNKNPNDISDTIHEEIVLSIFRNQDELNNDQFNSEIRLAFSMKGVDFGIVQARQFITYYKLRDMVKVKTGYSHNRTFYCLPDRLKDVPF